MRQSKCGEAQQGALELLLVLKAERTTGAAATLIAPSASACTVERIPFELTESEPCRGDTYLPIAPTSVAEAWC